MILKEKILMMVAIIIMSSCNELNSGDTGGRAVVESYLRPGDRMVVSISKESLFENTTTDTLDFIDGLTVWITEGENNYFLQSIGEGKYISDEDVKAEAETIYSLDFQFGDNALTASTYVPSEPQGFQMSASEIEVAFPEPGSGPPQMPDPIEISWENPDNDYHLVVVTVIEEDAEEIATGGAVRSVRSFRNEPNTGTTYRIMPLGFKYYGIHAVILYKLNPEYAALYEDTGNSSLNLKSPYSNIANGLGIFTGVNSDTLYLNVKKP